MPANVFGRNEKPRVTEKGVPLSYLVNNFQRKSDAKQLEVELKTEEKRLARCVEKLQREASKHMKLYGRKKKAD